MLAFRNFFEIIFLFSSFFDVQCCENPHETATIMMYHLFSQNFHEQKLEDDVLISNSSGEHLRHCHATIQNCCSRDAENIYLAYKFAEDLGSVSQFSYIRSRLDTFLPIFIHPFKQSLEHALVELFHYVLEMGASPYHISSTISRLYSSILSTLSMPSTSAHLATSFRNFFAETKLMIIAQLTGVVPGSQHCLSSQLDLLNSLKITSSKSAEISALKIQMIMEKELIYYVEHFFFFIEMLSSIEKIKFSSSCAESFERLFLCRLCRGRHKTTSHRTYNSSLDSAPTPQVIRLLGSPCPNQCLNVVRGCHAGLVGLRTPLAQLSRDFIELSQLLQNAPSGETLSDALLSKNTFLEAIQSWTINIDQENQGDWHSIGVEIQKRCTNSPQIKSDSMESASDIAEFLREATSKGMRAAQHRHSTASNGFVKKRWKQPIVRNETAISELRLAQQSSYLAMERLIADYMTPEKLFFEHLGQPCLEGDSKNCWNGHGFYNEFEHLAEFTMQGQLKNPAVRVTTADLIGLNSRLVPKMLSHSKEIRSLMHQIKRRSSDTEERSIKAPPFPPVSQDDSLLFHPHVPFEPPVHPLHDISEGPFGGPLGIDEEKKIYDYDYENTGVGSGYYPDQPYFGHGFESGRYQGGNGSDDYNDWGSFPGQGESSFRPNFPFIEGPRTNEDKMDQGAQTTSCMSQLHLRLLPWTFALICVSGE